MAGDLASNRDEMLTMLVQAWKEAPSVISGLGQLHNELVLTMTDNDGVPSGMGRKTWARVTIQHGTGTPTSISRRRWENIGLLTVQCFIWRDKTSDDARVQALASFIVGKLRDHIGSVLFLDAYAREGRINNGFAQCDAVSRFKWEEFRGRAPVYGQPEDPTVYVVLTDETGNFYFAFEDSNPLDLVN